MSFYKFSDKEKSRIITNSQNTTMSVTKFSKTRMNISSNDKQVQLNQTSLVPETIMKPKGVISKIVEESIASDRMFMLNKPKSIISTRIIDANLNNLE